MEGEQIRLNLPKRQAHHGTQVRDEARRSHSQSSLSQNLLLQVDRSFVPFLAPRTPAFEHAMVGDFYGRWGRNIDHFSHTSQTDPSQAQMAVWTRNDAMFHYLGGLRSSTSMVMLRITLFSYGFLFGSFLFHIGFDKGWRRCFLFFQFFNPSQSDTQQILCLLQRFAQFLVFLPKVSYFFLVCHSLSLS